jgi:NADPH2:quinone reductase
MNAITISKFGERGTLQSMPDSMPKSDEALVRITAAGVNPYDWIKRDGFAGEHAMPMVLGQDFAGVISKVGGSDPGFSVGDRVFGVAGTHGSYAQQTTVRVSAKTDIVGKIPDGVTDAQAAALATPGMTALACVEALKVAKGTSFVIYGAAGSVGLFALQIAVARGAHVIAIVKGSVGDTKRFGAEGVIDTEATDIVAGIQVARSQGVDAVLDLVSSKNDEAMRFADVLRRGGAIASTKGAVDVEAFEKRGFSASNIELFSTPQARRPSLEALAALVAAGSIVVTIERELPLKDAADVLDKTKSGTYAGKTVLKV